MLNRSLHFFGDMLPAEAFGRKVIVANPDADFSEIMWDAAFGSVRHAALPVQESELTSYTFDEVDYSEITPDRYLSEEEIIELIEFAKGN